MIFSDYAAIAMFRKHVSVQFSMSLSQREWRRLPSAFKVVQSKRRSQECHKYSHNSCLFSIIIQQIIITSHT